MYHLLVRLGVSDCHCRLNMYLTLSQNPFPYPSQLNERLVIR